MKGSVILEFQANDIYELATNIFLSTKEMARCLKKTTNHCQCLITRKTVCNGKRYIRVWLEDDGKEIEIAE